MRDLSEQTIFIERMMKFFFHKGTLFIWVSLKHISTSSICVSKIAEPVIQIRIEIVRSLWSFQFFFLLFRYETRFVNTI